MYTPILTPNDFSTHIYSEKLAAITRQDSDIITNAVESAIDEAKLYLSPRYNVVFLFGDKDLDSAATVRYELLNNLIKSIAVWHICRLANVGIDLQIVRTDYEDAIKTLTRIQKLQLEPKWPLIDNSTVDTTFSPVYKNSRKKRSNNW